MNVEIITVGTEIILGNIVNTNAAFLSEECAKLGLALYFHTAVGDNEERLSNVIESGLTRSDILIITGGLGPTEDDITKEIAAKVMNKGLVMDSHSRLRIQEFFNRSYQGKSIPENNYKQALVPEDAIIMDNDNGTAPGIIIEKDEKSLILLPGPPNELVPMFFKDVVPYLKNKAEGIIYSNTVKICGLGESAVEMQIKDLIVNQENPTIATYAKTGEVHVRITTKADTIESAQVRMTPLLQEVKNRFHNYIYTIGDEESLEAAVVTLLKKNNLTLSTAESCTGGLLAGRLINVSGISEVFMQGYITYSNKAKRKILGVKKETLEKYGAVSEKTAKEMAKGGAEVSKTDVCVSVTGIAGPDGGTPDKPVGLVYISCHIPGRTVVKEFHFMGNRTMVREKTVSAALTLLWKCVKEYENTTEQ